MKINIVGKRHSTPKIGYVVKRYPRFSETFIVNEVLAHEAAGWELEIFSLRTSVDTHFQDVISKVRAPVHYLQTGSQKSSAFLQSCRQMAKRRPEFWSILASESHANATEIQQSMMLAHKVREQGIQHLHAHFATSAATVTRLAAAIAGISYSVTMHAKDIFHESVDPVDLGNKIRDASFVVTVSEFNREFLIREYGYGEKIFRIYNGLDLNRFCFKSNDSHSRKIVSVGRLVEKKGLSDLVDACHLLRERNVEFECDIIGNGELESDLRNQIKSLKLGSLVRLIGPRPQSTLRGMIQSSAVFVAPCVVGNDGNRDGLPTVITETLALGTPCISTDVTGIPEIVRHGETGIIAEQRNPIDLANQIERLLDAPEKRKELALAGRSLIESCFDIHRNVEQIRELTFASLDRQSNTSKTAQLLNEVG